MSSDINSYNNSQIILSSDRLIFNSRVDNIFINSGNIINLSAKQAITFDVGEADSQDASKKFIVNAPYIQFGISRFQSSNLEPLTKAQSLDDVFIEILNMLNIIFNLIQSDLPNTGSIAINQLQSLTLKIENELINYHSNIANTY